MASDTTLQIIYNLALSHLGQKPVDNTTDETLPEILACNTMFPIARNAVLSEIAFAFNSAPIELSQYTTINSASIPSWSYYYTYPSSALTVWEVYSSSNASMAWDKDFEVRYLPATGEKIICTDEQAAYANVSYLVTDYTLWDDRFIEAASWKLASLIAVSIGADTDKADKAKENFLFMINDAKRKSAREKRKKPGVVNSYKTSRG